MSPLHLVTCLVGAAVWLACSPVPPVARPDTRSVAPVVLLLFVGLGVGAATVLSPRHAVLAALLAATAAGVGRVVSRQRAAREEGRRADRVLALCESLVGDLTAGSPPLLALRRAAEEWPELAPAAVAAEVGADVPAVLRGLAAHPGAGQLRSLAAGWSVAHRSGAGLAGTVAGAARAVRAERRVARLVGTELAAARATARILAVLPLGMLLLGLGIGGDPVAFLIGTWPGLGCLAGGLGLSFAGLRWLDAVADRVLGS